MQGRILKGVGGFYTILTEDGSKFVCNARGRMRFDGIKPLPGDRAEFDATENPGYILDILPRKNELVRPNVSNIDKLIVVISASNPLPDFLMVDKLTVFCEQKDILPVLVANKLDEAIGDNLLERFNGTGYERLYVSAKSGEGIQQLMDAIKDKTACFAGQSAVGKSSIINSILPGIGLEVGDVSAKTKRGKHTTRHAELIPLDSSTIIIDTPGFSILDLEATEPEELVELFAEMRGLNKMCEFSSCTHVAETNCAIKDALKDGRITEARYSSYKLLVQDLITKRNNRYN